MLAHSYSPGSNGEIAKMDGFRSHFLRNLLVFLATLIICAVFVLLMLSLKPSSSSTCSPGYTLNQDLQKCYKVFRIQQTFEKSYGKCLQGNGLVASIHDSKTNDYLADLYKHNDTKPLEDVKEFWIGLVVIDGNWSWVDGKPVDWLNWDAGMPEKNLTGRNVVMNVEADKNGNKWKTIGKEEQRPFVCEKLISK